jgi:CheY-like chemotaxis protein
VPPPLRALVVDDNDVVRRLLELALEEAGFVPIGAESGEVALESVRAAPPDVCVVDEIMPGMCGAELIRRLRGAGDPRVASVPVVGISSRADSERTLRDAGADAFLLKPVDDGALLDALARALAARRREPASTEPSSAA